MGQRRITTMDKTGRRVGPGSVLRFPRPKDLPKDVPHCPSCGTQDPERFYKNKHTSYGRQHYCNKCHAFNFRPGEIPRELLLERERQIEEQERIEVLALVAERKALKAFLERVSTTWDLNTLAVLEANLPSGSEGVARDALEDRLGFLCESQAAQ
jgi:hypothetical protein